MNFYLERITITLCVNRLSNTNKLTNSNISLRINKNVATLENTTVKFNKQYQEKKHNNNR